MFLAGHLSMPVRICAFFIAMVSKLGITAVQKRALDIQCD